MPCQLRMDITGQHIHGQLIIYNSREQTLMKQKLASIVPKMRPTSCQTKAYALGTSSISYSGHSIPSWPEPHRDIARAKRSHKPQLNVKARCVGNLQCNRASNPQDQAAPSWMEWRGLSRAMRVLLMTHAMSRVVSSIPRY